MAQSHSKREELSVERILSVFKGESIGPYFRAFLRHL